MPNYNYNLPDDAYAMTAMDGEKPRDFPRGRVHHRSCCDRLCCGCCTCCPRWIRYIACIIFLIIIAIAIVIGVLAGLFKKPTVEYTGVQSTPAFSLSGTTVNLNMSLGFYVDNPNVESVTFKTIKATTYYQGDSTAIGGGTLDDLHIGSHSVTNFTFPMNLAFDTTANSTQTILKRVIANCNSNQNIPLDYDVTATVSIIGISVNIPFSSSVSVACPTDANSQTVMNQIQQALNTIA